MSDNVILIAGPSAAKSTFAGGLYHYGDKSSEYSAVPTVWGDENEFENKLVDKMFMQGEYPDRTLSGYVATFEISGKAFTRPGLEVDIIDFPGEKIGPVWNPPDDDPLPVQIRKGNVDDKETVAERFRKDVRPAFERGQGPGRNDWKTLFLHYYYRADKAVFLMNMLKTVDESQISVDVDADFIYGPEEIKQANSDFTDVAFIPIAVDWYDYDPDSFNPGFVRRFANQVLSPSLRDQELMNYLQKRIGPGHDPKAGKILNSVENEGEIDFFSVSVPDRGSPQSTDGYLTDDGQGGFVVKGFDEVFRWLQT